MQSPPTRADINRILHENHLDPDLVHTIDTDGTLIGPRPRDEEHRKQLQHQIRLATACGLHFDVVYLAEYIVD